MIAELEWTQSNANQNSGLQACVHQYNCTHIQTDHSVFCTILEHFMLHIMRLRSDVFYILFSNDYDMCFFGN